MVYKCYLTVIGSYHATSFSIGIIVCSHCLCLYKMFKRRTFPVKLRMSHNHFLRIIHRVIRFRYKRWPMRVTKREIKHKRFFLVSLQKLDAIFGNPIRWAMLLRKRHRARHKPFQQHFRFFKTRTWIFSQIGIYFFICFRYCSMYSSKMSGFFPIIEIFG